MRQLITIVAITLCTSPSLAQDNRSSPPALTPKNVDIMMDSYERALIEGRAWKKIMPSLEGLYRELRQNDQTRKEAMHSLRRIGLPGVDISEFGERGQEIRRDLDRVTQYIRLKDNLSESASVAATFISLHEVLQTLEAIERPNRIHIAIQGEDGIAKERRSESLHEGGKPRHIFEFTERLTAKETQECTVDTMHIVDDVYFTLTCRANGKETYPMAAVSSKCTVSNDRMVAASLVLQPTEAAEHRRVYVWCSNAPL
jgi:hypothetical protein